MPETITQIQNQSPMQAGGVIGPEAFTMGLHLGVPNDALELVLARWCKPLIHKALRERSEPYALSMSAGHTTVTVEKRLTFDPTKLTKELLSSVFFDFLDTLRRQAGQPVAGIEITLSSEGLGQSSVMSIRWRQLFDLVKS